MLILILYIYCLLIDSDLYTFRPASSLALIFTSPVRNARSYEIVSHGHMPMERVGLACQDPRVGGQQIMIWCAMVFSVMRALKGQRRLGT